MLDAARIIDEAERQTGQIDRDTHLRVNLCALVDAINGDGQLSSQGHASAHANLVRRTADRLEGQRWIADHPAIAQENIRAPVFLTGLPRSGTTYFQYLMDRDPRFRLIRTWESLMPNPPPGAEPGTIAPRKAFEAELRNRLRPREIENFAALHLIDDDGPDECHAFMEQAWAAAGFMNLYDVPSYFDFLMERLDMVAAYQAHRRQLQLLQWQCPRPRWALKYPNHVLAMEAILAVHPDARFVMTHRDPLQTLASIARMTLSLRTARYDAPVDPRRVGAHMLDFIDRHIARIMAFCNGPHAERVTHVDYYRLVADPAAMLGEIHAGIGIDTPDSVREAVAGWRRANPKNKRGANDYSLEQFGLDPGAVRERFHAYIRHFAIPDEASGIAGQSTPT